MTNEELIKKIEELNLENINLMKSKEYKIGSDILKLLEMIKKLKFIEIINKKINRKKVKKLNAHAELENNFKYNNKFNKKPKIVVYTCITGKYDKLLEPFIKCDNIDFVCLTEEKFKSENWKFKKIPTKLKNLNNIFINRYIKFHPNEIFSKEYDYSIYIDGNIKVMSDLTELIYGINNKTGLALHRHQFRNCIYNEIEVCKLIGKGNYEKMKKQTDEYKKEGFPKEFGLYECNVIVSDLKNKNSKNILNNWWDEFNKSYSFRDQIAFPYVVWKQGYKFNDIGSLGNNVYANPKIRIEKHIK